MANIFPIDFEEKLTMAQNDYILFSDSEDGNKIKKAQYQHLKWEQGDPWTAATISVGTVSTGAAWSSASVTNTGTATAAVLDFVIPQWVAGTPWADGNDWAAATITVGTTTTLPAGSSATVTNTGTSSAAVLDFGIPKWDTGTWDVSWPNSSTDGDLAVFDGATGKIIKDWWALTTKVFTLASTSDLTNAQAAYDWYASWKEAIILFSWRYYYFKSTWSGSVYFAVNEYTTLDNTNVTSLVQKTLTLVLSWTTVSSISSWNMSLTNYNVLRTGKDYWTPYTPQYDGSPATKKYVDDHTATVASTAPATPSQWDMWYDTVNDVLKIYDGSNWNEVGSWGGWDVIVSTQANNLLTTGMAIRCGTQANYESLGTYDSNSLYLIIE